MTRPTDEQLEAMAKSLAFVANRTGMTIERCEAITDRAAAMLRAMKGRVRVKPLEWHGFSSAFIAYTIIGDYHVSRCGENWHWYFEEQDPYLEGTIAASEETATAAVQADYEARILAALEPAPDHSDWNAAIEAAARAQEAAYRKGIFGEKHSDHIRTLKKGPPQ